MTPYAISLAEHHEQAAKELLAMRKDRHEEAGGLVDTVARVATGNDRMDILEFALASDSALRKTYEPMGLALPDPGPDSPQAAVVRADPDEWLRERLGATLAAGLLVHTGPRVFPLAERIAAVPIASLWSPPTSTQAISTHAIATRVAWDPASRVARDPA